MRKNKKKAFCQYFFFALAGVLTFALVGSTDAQVTYVQTGFEEFLTGNPPKDWEIIGSGFEVSDATVRTDKKALAILGRRDIDGPGVPIETENPIISVEFWVYIEGDGRSFNFKVASADSFGQKNGCTYINWNAGIVRLYNGAAWQTIGDFETDTWQYVHIVADVSKSEFNFSSGDDRDDTLGAKPKKDLPFWNAALGPAAKWIGFCTSGITAPGYVDDLLVYEGGEALDLAVDLGGKLAAMWGHIKRQSVLE